MGIEDSGQLDLRDYVAVLRRRWWIIAAFAVIFGSTAFVISNQDTPLYSASAQVLVDFQSATQFVNPAGNQFVSDAQRALENEVRFADSDLLRNRIAETFGYSPALALGGDKTADTLTFSSTSPDPVAAAREANQYAATYIEMRTQRQVNNFKQATQGIDSLLGDLKRQLNALPAGPASDNDRAGLDSQIRYYEGQRSALAVSAEVGAASGATQIMFAAAPASPVSPRPVRSGVLAAVVGLMLGSGLAFLLEFLDDTIRDTTTLARLTPELALLGTIPRRDADAQINPAASGGTSYLGEAFRSLRTSVQFAGLRRPLRALQITAANASEGKTTVATFLAVSMAHAGERVVLVDGDLRSPSVHERFGLRNDIGLSNVILRQVSLHDALQEVPGLANLHVLASGPMPGNPADFLWSANVPDDVPTLPYIVKHLTDQGAFVIVDSPPVLPVADAMTLSRMVDGTLFVVRANATGSRELERAFELLDQADANIIGEVMNQAGEDDTDYGYGYGYEHTPRWKRRLRHVGLMKRKELRPRIEVPPELRPSPAPLTNTPISPAGSAAYANRQLERPSARKLGAEEPRQREDQAAPITPRSGVATGNGHHVPSDDDDELIKRLRAHLGVGAQASGRDG